MQPLLQGEKRNKVLQIIFFISYRPALPRESDIFFFLADVWISDNQGAAEVIYTGIYMEPILEAACRTIILSPDNL